MRQQLFSRVRCCIASILKKSAMILHITYVLFLVTSRFGFDFSIVHVIPLYVKLMELYGEDQKCSSVLRGADAESSG